MTSMIVLSIISLGLGLIQTIGQEINTSTANQIKTKYSGLVQQLTNQLSNDQSLLNSLTVAYQNRNTQLFNKLAYASPFGDSYRQLKSKIKEQADVYSDKVTQINKRMGETQQTANELTQKGYEATGSVASNIAAHKEFDKNKQTVEQITSQNIQGGLQDVQTKKE